MLLSSTQHRTKLSTKHCCRMRDFYHCHCSFSFLSLPRFSFFFLLLWFSACLPLPLLCVLICYLFSAILLLFFVACAINIFSKTLFLAIPILRQMNVISSSSFPYTIFSHTIIGALLIGPLRSSVCFVTTDDEILLDLSESCDETICKTLFSFFAFSLILRIISTLLPDYRLPSALICTQKIKYSWLDDIPSRKYSFAWVGLADGWNCCAYLCRWKDFNFSSRFCWDDGGKKGVIPCHHFYPSFLLFRYHTPEMPPTINSYARRIFKSFSPLTICWRVQILHHQAHQKEKRKVQSLRFGYFIFLGILFFSLSLHPFHPLA